MATIHGNYQSKSVGYLVVAGKIRNYFPILAATEITKESQPYTVQ